MWSKLAIWMCLYVNRKWKIGDCSFRSLGGNYRGLPTDVWNQWPWGCSTAMQTDCFMHSVTDYTAENGPVMKKGIIPAPTDAALASTLKHKSTGWWEGCLFGPWNLSLNKPFLWTGTKKAIINQWCVSKMVKEKLHYIKQKWKSREIMIINKSYGMFQWHHIQVILFKSLIISGSCKHRSH